MPSFLQHLSIGSNQRASLPAYLCMFIDILRLCSSKVMASPVCAFPRIDGRGLTCGLNFTTTSSRGIRIATSQSIENEKATCQMYGAAHFQTGSFAEILDKFSTDEQLDVGVFKRAHEPYSALNDHAYWDPLAFNPSNPPGPPFLVSATRTACNHCPRTHPHGLALATTVRNDRTSHFPGPIVSLRVVHSAKEQADTRLLASGYGSSGNTTRPDSVD